VWKAGAAHPPALHAAVLETRDGKQLLPDMRPTIGAIAIAVDGDTLATADMPPVRGWPTSSDPGCVV
jgi:endonuclease YncB( thermonuclease family)